MAGPVGAEIVEQDVLIALPLGPPTPHRDESAAPGWRFICHPEATEDEIDDLLTSWLHDRPGAEHGGILSRDDVRRPQDFVDLRALLYVASAEERERAAMAPLLSLIDSARGLR